MYLLLIFDGVYFMAGKGMAGKDRREKLIKLLTEADSAISGAELSEKLGVSRQIIVQDIAILKAEEYDIISTNRGYVLLNKGLCERTFKVRHSADMIGEELYSIVDLGGKICDVFVYHKIYGVIKAPMSIKTRKDVYEYLKTLSSGISSPLLTITDNYHYHTVLAEDEETLDRIQEMLKDKGFLAELRDYEPVDFWANKNADNRNRTCTPKD